ncbi:MAG: DUF6364 family protein [Bacillota bacterium]
MDYQNVTLSLPKEILRKAKHIAIERGTSLSGLLTQLLVEIARKEEGYRQAKEHHLSMLGSIDLGTKGNVNWARRDLHDR